MPNSDTFDVRPIGEFVRRHLSGSSVSIDPFARNKRWATWTNDLNPGTDAEYHMEANEFMAMLREKSVRADLLILDPPYSPRQVKECYSTMGLKMQKRDALSSVRSQWKENALPLLTAHAKVLSFGWNSVGMGKKLGFRLTEILLVCHGSDHNDTICLCEERTL